MLISTTSHHIMTTNEYNTTKAGKITINEKEGRGELQRKSLNNDCPPLI